MTRHKEVYQVSLLSIWENYSMDLEHTAGLSDFATAYIGDFRNPAIYAWEALRSELRKCLIS